MNLVALPAFADNYIWMLHDGAQAVVVDPGDAAPVDASLDRLQLQLAQILVTHHHPDHVAGVDALRHRLQGPVHAPARESIPHPFILLNGGDAVAVPASRFEVVDGPGHTAGRNAKAGVDTANAALPGETRVCCTHGYTPPNLRLAAAVEADNPAVDVLGRTADQPVPAQPRSGCHRSGPRPGRSNGGPGRRAGRLA